MGEVTKIQWCDHTFNPWRGCTKVSQGCSNCYAEAQSKRNPGVLGVWGDEGTRVVASESKWKEPLKWNAEAAQSGDRRRVFCASLADVFEDWRGQMISSKGNPFWWCHGCLSNSPLPSTGITKGCQFATMDDIRDRLFQLIEDTPHLDWLLLTKRPERWRKCWPLEPVPGHVSQNQGDGKRWVNYPNLWMGTSVEDQETANARIPELLKIPAAVRFLSMEPLLGPVDLFAVPRPDDAYFTWRGERGCIGLKEEPDDYVYWQKREIHWVIVGGESGPHARSCDLEWIRSIRDQCAAGGVACFVKQLGGKAFTHDLRPPLRMGGYLNLIDSHGGDPEEWPEDLRVREVPRVAAVAG